MGQKTGKTGKEDCQGKLARKKTGLERDIPSTPRCGGGGRIIIVFREVCKAPLARGGGEGREEISMYMTSLQDARLAGLDRCVALLQGAE